MEYPVAICEIKYLSNRGGNVPRRANVKTEDFAERTYDS